MTHKEFQGELIKLAESFERLADDMEATQSKTAFDASSRRFSPSSEYGRLDAAPGRGELDPLTKFALGY